MRNDGIARKQASTWIGSLAMVAGVLAMFGGQAYARSAYLTSFNGQYGTSGTALDTCNVCHGSGGTSTWNSYGQAIQSQGSSVAITTRMTNVESLDSDGDGFTNGAEITARTFPGDPGSKPTPTDTTRPTVGSTNPAGDQAGVAVNVAVTATFSEAVKSVSTTTFTLKAGTTSVAGAVTLSGATATFTPSAPLANATTFTATITTGVTDLANNALAANYTWNFTTGAASDTTPPTVSSTNPVAGATAVPAAAAVTATFSEAVKSVSTTTFTLKAGTTSVAGTVGLSGTTATFTPSAPLANATTYTATITTGVTDLANNPLAANYTWTFTTGAAGDTTPPTVSSTNPAGNQTGVAVNSDVTATFSEAVKSVSTTTFTLKAGTTPVAGAVTLSGTTATFNPSASLANATTYTATITTGVTDLANNALAANYTWNFTTGATADTTPPTVNSTNPADNQTGVPANTAVTATFSEAMAGTSLTSATFTLVDASGNPVAGTVTSAGATATFAPTAILANGTTYTATVTTGAKDLAGNGLAQSRAWRFTTVSGTSDTDGDGIPDNLDAFPNDNRKATVPNPMGGQGVTIDASSTGGARLMGVAAMADTDASLNQTGKPAGFGFGNGVIAFKVAGLAPGGSASVVLTFPASIPANAKIFKIDSGGYHEFPGAVISGNTVTLTLKDGGPGDADGVANGVIDDPVGLATPVVSSAPDSSGGGCAVAGTGGGPLDAVGAYGFLALIALGLLVRKAAPGNR